MNRLKRVIVGVIGAEVGALFFGFFAIAPWALIKLVILGSVFLLGMGLFAGIAVSIFEPADWGDPRD